MTENIVEHMNQNIAQWKQLAIVIAAGIGAAVVVMTLPGVYLENIVGAAGLPELIPATSPPLGNTARGLIAVMTFLVSASAAYYFLHRKGESDMTLALEDNSTRSASLKQGQEEKARFAFPKFNVRSLTRFLRKPKNEHVRIMDLADLPQLRIMNGETETPTRAPLFAESGETPATSLFTRERVYEETTPAVKIPVEELPVQEAQIEEVPVVEAPVVGKTLNDLADLTIAQLADRLEAGLHRLKQLESSLSGDAPEAQTSAIPEAPEPMAAPVSNKPLHQDIKPREETEASRHADMDAALKAAMGALEKMTAQR